MRWEADPRQCGSAQLACWTAAAPNGSCSHSARASQRPRRTPHRRCAAPAGLAHAAPVTPRTPPQASSAPSQPGLLQRLGRVLREKAAGDLERFVQGTSKTRERLGVSGSGRRPRRVCTNPTGPRLRANEAAPTPRRAAAARRSGGTSPCF
jgi:hypothetical protein